MNQLIILILAIVMLGSCSETEQKREDLNKSEIIITNPIGENKIEFELKTKKVGQELFQSILDTIQVKPISTELLINNKWIYKPFENCEYYLQFGVNNKGKNYNCELVESFDITYKIEGNKLLVSEYDIPHVDNQEMKKFKSSDQTFAFNGHSLIMVDSKMYNIAGHERIPQIEVVIRYEKK